MPAIIIRREWALCVGTGNRRRIRSIWTGNNHRIWRQDRRPIFKSPLSFYVFIFFFSLLYVCRLRVSACFLCLIHSPFWLATHMKNVRRRSSDRWPPTNKTKGGVDFVYFGCPRHNFIFSIGANQPSIQAILIFFFRCHNFSHKLRFFFGCVDYFDFLVIWFLCLLFNRRWSRGMWHVLDFGLLPSHPHISPYLIRAFVAGGWWRKCDVSSMRHHNPLYIVLRVLWL